MSATVVNFCTNEVRYLRACLEQALFFSKQVIVAVCDHFFDGTAEDQLLLERIYAAFPQCLFVEYPFIPEAIPKRVFRRIEPAHFWHSLSRFVATQFLDAEVEWVLFLDADEIPEGGAMRQWLQGLGNQRDGVLKLANYWYFREPYYQALQWEDSPVLVRKEALSIDRVLHTQERDALYNLAPYPKRREVVGLNGAPMIHHYSWVRTQEEMLRKVQSWGHRGDRDWKALVKEEFSRPFSGVDFVHGYEYRTVPCPFSLDPSPEFSRQGTPQVVRLDKEGLLALLKPLLFSPFRAMMKGRLFRHW